LFLPDWPLARLQLDAMMRGFSGPYLTGWSPMLGGAYVWRSGLRLRLEGGYYHYANDLAASARDNTWLKLGLSHALTRRWSVAADYRHDWGDDIAGRRWFLELRHRF
jgi:hypothetical protein